jgi:S1-C subfamily serine protease
MRRLIAVLLLVGFCAASSAPAQKFYKWTDADGRVQYTQTPPPQGVAREQKQVTQTVVSEERRRYCGAIRQVAIQLAMIRDSVPIASAGEAMRQFQSREGIDIAQVDLRELVNYVYSSAHSRSNRGGSNSDEIAGRAMDACLGGSFGNYGKSQAQAGAAGESGPAKPGAIASQSSGTGWVTHGLIATNHHVIDGYSRIRVHLADGRDVRAWVLATDAENDLALLSVSEPLPAGLPLAAEEAPMGSAVYTLGYPHPDIMGRNAKLTTGVVNARTGIRDDPRHYQVSVPVQAGNSGGPLLDERGQVIGLVTSKLSASAVYGATGDLPQNVNYAVKVEFLRQLLQSHARGGDNLPASAGSLDQQVARVAPAVVQVIAR